MMIRRFVLVFIFGRLFGQLFGWLLIGLFGFLSGCDFSSLSRSSAPSTSQSQTHSSSIDHSSDEEWGGNAKQSKEHSELLHEIITVVFLKQPTDKTEFGSLVNTLNQGASLEGIYNGFVHSSVYRKSELLSEKASPQTLQAFSQELAALEILFSEPTLFNSEAAKPLPVLDPTDLSSPVLEKVKKTNEEKRNEIQLAQEYQETFHGAPFFTLKRILGDEAIKLIRLKKDSAQDLSDWYGKWTERMASKNVDFGLPQRNKSDGRFHGNWARSAPWDRVEWEVLNRLHRYLNQVQLQSALHTQEGEISK